MEDDKKEPNGEPKNKGGRPKKAGTKPKPWSLRGVEMEARRLYEKAAKRSGKTNGEYFNTEIREFLAGQITKADQPPAAPQDIENMIDAKLKTASGEMVREIVSQIKNLAEQEQRQEPQRKGIIARLLDSFKG